MYSNSDKSYANEKPIQTCRGLSYHRTIANALKSHTFVAFVKLAK